MPSRALSTMKRYWASCSRQDRRASSNSSSIFGGQQEQRKSADQEHDVNRRRDDGVQGRDRREAPQGQGALCRKHGGQQDKAAAKDDAQGQLPGLLLQQRPGGQGIEHRMDRRDHGHAPLQAQADGGQQDEAAAKDDAQGRLPCLVCQQRPGRQGVENRMDRRHHDHAPPWVQAGGGKGEHKDNAGGPKVRAPADGMAANGEEGPAFVGAPRQEQGRGDDGEVGWGRTQEIEAQRAGALEALGGDPKRDALFARLVALKDVEQAGKDERADGEAQDKRALVHAMTS